MKLKNLSDEALLSETKAYVAREREMTLAVLHRLREVERRRLHVKEGYSSLFAFTTEELGYDSASATRRIDAMHLLVELPEIEQKIQDGSLNLTHVSRAESFFRKEPMALEKKKEIVAQLESKTTRQAEKTLLQFSKTPFVHLREKIKPVTPELSEVVFFASDEVLEQLERLKGLLAHSHPGMSTGDLIATLARMGLERLDPALRGRGGQKRPRWWVIRRFPRLLGLRRNLGLPMESVMERRVKRKSLLWGRRPVRGMRLVLRRTNQCVKKSKEP